MQAVILAAGKGSRLASAIGDLPKCLAPVGKRTIVEHQIFSLRAMGVKDIAIITGYKSEQVKDHVNKNFENITFIENKGFATTNTIVSFYLSLPFIKEDFFLLNGDVIFGTPLLQKILDEKETGLAIEMKACGEEEVKVKIRDNRISEISKQVAPKKAAGEFIGVALFRKKDHPSLFSSLVNEVEIRGAVKDYFERALNSITERTLLIPVDITGEPVVEIDFPEDLEKARAMVIQTEKAS